MRIFAISDIHIDFKENRRWLYRISKKDYKDDILILGGDISDIISLIEEGFEVLKNRFAEVLFVPGNHDLWVYRNEEEDSLEKFHNIKIIAEKFGINMGAAHFDSLSIVPLFSWYDYSFGKPSKELYNIWMDYSSCKWPGSFDEAEITRHFSGLNEDSLDIKNQFIISFSHFMPRIDLMPNYIPVDKKILYPVLGSIILEQQIRKLNSNIHIYGHSHLNMNIYKDNTLYINNAYGYPYETIITAKKLLCVYET